jgi:DNA modification methylase
MKIPTVSNGQSWSALRPRGYCRDLPPAGIGEPTPPVEIVRNQILVGDALTTLRNLPSHSVDCIVTSPAYVGLRVYGSTTGELGRESSVDAWVENLREVMRETARVMKPAGSAWVNLGDAFSNHPKWGAPAKSMLAAPERLLLALMNDGWLLRSRVIWHKTSARPTSAVDRLSLNYEYVYQLVRSPRYYFDLGAIRIPHKTKVKVPTRPASMPLSIQRPAWSGPLASGNQSGLLKARLDGRPGHPDGKNPGSVFSIAPRGFPGHPAAFPPDLIRRPILATCPEVVCSRCGMPSRRAAQACDCRSTYVKGLVLDIFMGSGTTGVVAQQLDRDYLGIELSPKFAELARQRIKEASRGG